MRDYDGKTGERTQIRSTVNSTKLNFLKNMRALKTFEKNYTSKYFPP